MRGLRVALRRRQQRRCEVCNSAQSACRCACGHHGGSNLVVCSQHARSVLAEGAGSRSRTLQPRGLLPRCCVQRCPCKLLPLLPLVLIISLVLSISLVQLTLVLMTPRVLIVLARQLALALAVSRVLLARAAATDAAVRERGCMLRCVRVQRRSRERVVISAAVQLPRAARPR